MAKQGMPAVRMLPERRGGRGPAMGLEGVALVPHH